MCMIFGVVREVAADVSYKIACFGLLDCANDAETLIYIEPDVDSLSRSIVTDSLVDSTVSIMTYISIPPIISNPPHILMSLPSRSQLRISSSRHPPPRDESSTVEQLPPPPGEGVSLKHPRWLDQPSSLCLGPSSLCFSGRPRSGGPPPPPLSGSHTNVGSDDQLIFVQKSSRSQRLCFTPAPQSPSCVDPPSLRTR